MTAFIDLINTSSAAEIDMTEVDEVRSCLLKPWGFKEFDQGLLRNITETCLIVLHEVEWDEHNAQRFNNKIVTQDQIIFQPSPLPIPRPYAAGLRHTS